MDLGPLASAVAWPPTALVIFFTFRLRAAALLDALRVKLGQAEQVSIGKDGLTLISTIARQNALASSPPQRDLARAAPAAAGLLDLPIEDEPAEFERLVREYGACDIPDRAGGIRVRRRLADRLGELALSLSLDRRTLATSGVEGRMVAVATAVILNPRAGDLLVLNEAAKRADYNFTRHRIMLALPPALTVEHDTEAMRLASSALGSAEGQPNADGSLLGLIQATRRVAQPR